MIFWVIFNVLYFWVADLHPRSRIFLGCIVDFQQGLFSSADGTSANQRGERAVHVLKIFGSCRVSLTAPPSSCSPRTGYIQRRFSAASFWYPHFEQSVTAFASLSPLPPFISLRSLRLKNLRRNSSATRYDFLLRRFGLHSSNVSVRLRRTA